MQPAATAARVVGDDVMVVVDFSWCGFEVVMKDLAQDVADGSSF